MLGGKVSGFVQRRGLVFASVALGLLASCASTRTLLQEERADRETIEAAFLAEDPALRCLAARSCLWSPTDDCNERLGALAVEDEDTTVRICAVDVLAARCADGARASLADLRPRISPEVEEAFLGAARRCPSADLHLALAEEGLSAGEPIHLGPPPGEGWRERWHWLLEIAPLDPPRERTLAALEEVRRELDVEEAEKQRRQEAEDLLRQAEVLLGQGALDEARRLGTQAALRGADAQILLRRIEMASLLEAGEHLLEARDAENPRAALARLAAAPWGFDLLYPEARGIGLLRRYEEDLREAREIEALARQGDVDAALFRLQRLPEQTLTQPFIDLAAVAEYEALRLVAQGKFEEAWTRAWLARADLFISATPFLRAFAEAQWREEGLAMDREQLATYLARVEDHAPTPAKERAFILELEARVRRGDASAARTYLASFAERGIRAAGRCFGETEGLVPEPLVGVTIDQVSPLLEYGALHVTTVGARRALRARKKQSEELAHGAHRLVDELEKLTESVAACADGIQTLDYHRGARPGSEAHRIVGRASEKILQCGARAEGLLRRIEDRGSACLRLLNEVGTLMQEAFADE